jgi:hypothetical protein
LQDAVSSGHHPSIKTYLGFQGKKKWPEQTIVVLTLRDLQKAEPDYKSIIYLALRKMMISVSNTS